MKMLSSCMYVKELSICFSVAIILTIPHCEYGLTVVATKRVLMRSTTACNIATTMLWGLGQSF